MDMLTEILNNFVSQGSIELEASRIRALQIKFKVAKEVSIAPRISRCLALNSLILSYARATCVGIFKEPATMFSKFVSSVSSNIHKTYEVQPNPKFHSGPWSVYDAQRRASSTPRPAHQNQVSVFVFEKKSLEQSTSLRSSTGSTRAKNEIVFTRLKKEVSLLSRLRHPCLLEVVEPIEDTRGALTFVTERVISNLQALVGGVDDLDGFSDSSSRGGVRRSELDELETLRLNTAGEADEVTEFFLTSVCNGIPASNHV